MEGRFREIQIKTNLTKMKFTVAAVLASIAASAEMVYHPGHYQMHVPAYGQEHRYASVCNIPDLRPAYGYGHKHYGAHQQYHAPAPAMGYGHPGHNQYHHGYGHKHYGAHQQYHAPAPSCGYGHPGHQEYHEKEEKEHKE